MPSVLPAVVETLLARGARQPEVDQVHEIAARDQDVGRLDVAVDEPELVRTIEPVGHLADHHDGERRAERLLGLLQHRAEIAAFDEPHVQIQPAVDLAVSVDGDDVGIVDARGHLRLAAEACLERLVLRHVMWQDLERDHTVGLGVVGLVDLTHPAPADQLPELIVPEWCRIHRCSPRLRPSVC